MNIKFARIVALALTLIVVLSVFAGCSKTENYDNYSYGLTEDGMYENLDKYPCELPDFKSWHFTCDEILSWYVEEVVSNSDETIKSVDDYVYLYGKEFLAAMDLTDKEVAEEGDIVSATLEFYMDGKKMDQYSSTNNYEVVSSGDAIVSSFVGKKAKDEYEVEYTFPEDDADHPSETATVKVIINSVAIYDPIAEGVVEANLEALDEYLDGVTDVDSFLAALKPQLADATLSLLIENKLQSMDGIDPPEEYVDFEFYRLKCRLQQIGYSFEDYLKEAKMTEEEAREYCRLVARENYLAMLIFKDMDCELTEEQVQEYYGENLDYIASVQGMPYVRLNLIRKLVIYEVTKVVTVEGFDQNETSDAENKVSDDVPENATEPAEGDDVTEPIDNTESTIEDAASDVTEESTAPIE